MDEYLRVASSFHSPAREGVFLVLRVLFDVPADPGHMPHMLVGAPSPARPEDPKKLPRFPVLLQDDVPLLLVSGYTLIGAAERPERHVEYFREKGELRKKPLMPTKAPLALLQAWAKKAGSLYGDDAEEGGKLLIANQLLSLVDSVYRRESDLDGYRFWPTDNVDKHWKAIEAEVAKLDIRWSADKNCYTFKDGSHLPEPVRKLYRRHIWKLDGLNGEASLILERTGKKHVWVSLEWSGKTNKKMPAVALNVFAVKDKTNPLEKLRTTTMTASAGDQAFSSQSFSVELEEGEEIQVRFRIGKGEEASRVYRP